MKNCLRQVSIPLICAQILFSGPIAAQSSPASTEYKVCKSLLWMNHEENLRIGYYLTAVTAGLVATGAGMKVAYGVSTSKPRIERFKEYLALKKMKPAEIELNYLKLQKQHFSELAAVTNLKSISPPIDFRGTFVTDELDKNEKFFSRREFLTTETISSKVNDLKGEDLIFPSQKTSNAQQARVLNLMRIDKEEMMRITADTPEFKGKPIRLNVFYAKVAQNYEDKIAKIQSGSKIQPLQFSQTLADKYDYVSPYKSDRANVLGNASSKLKKEEAMSPYSSTYSAKYKLNRAADVALVAGFAAGIAAVVIPILAEVEKSKDNDGGIFEMYDFLPTLKKNYPQEFKRWMADPNLCMKELSKKAELLDIMDNWNESHKHDNAMKKAKVDNSDRGQAKFGQDSGSKETVKPTSKQH